ncbi:MAG TPA: hypothetical protein VGN68_05805 [Sphingopyxis sp.]|uniref:hypothetical protein n=1 Tax=Sphingopyxis sp. TaxID=1908224 RepID=UPI002E13714C|nr:hypothetical protein [Sphingopyxis sp.]
MTDTALRHSGLDPQSMNSEEGHAGKERWIPDQVRDDEKEDSNSATFFVLMRRTAR